VTRTGAHPVGRERRRGARRGLVVVAALAALIWLVARPGRDEGAGPEVRGARAPRDRTVGRELRDAIARVRAAPRIAIGVTAVRIAGRVIELRDRAPVGGVEVVLRGAAGELTTTTDAGGAYAITVPAGAYRAFVRDDQVLSVGRAGLVRIPGMPDPEAASAPDEALMTLVVADHDSDGVDLSVVRGGTVTGRVVDRGGRPVAGAIVRARGGLRPALATDLAETDRDGGFELRLPAGRVVLDASHPQLAGIADPATASLEIAPGDHLRPTLVLTAGCVISGRVVRADGTPAGDGALERQIDPARGFGLVGRVTDGGAFRWATVDAAEITLRAWPWKSAPSAAQVFSCHDGARITGVTFTLGDDPPDLAGVLVDATGAPVPHAYLDLAPLSPGGLGQQERSDDQGRWAIYRVPPGRYRIAAQADGLGVATAVVAAPHHDVRLALGGTGRLEGTTRATGSLEVLLGACLDGDGVTGLPPSHRLVAIRDGHFTVDDLPACDLQLAAVWRGQTTASRVTIPAGGTGHLALDFPPVPAGADEEVED
jgi:hypothetical protein